MKSISWMAGLFIFMLSFCAEGAERGARTPSVLRISALGSGKLLLNGKESSLAEIKTALEKARDDKGIIWYYRENPRSEPPPQAMEVVKLIVANHLPVSFSSKPDFSDYIDEKGQSQPRK